MGKYESEECSSPPLERNKPLLESRRRMHFQQRHGSYKNKYRAPKLHFAETSALESDYEEDDFELMECDGGDGIRVQDTSSIRACYANGTWRSSHKTYDPSPIQFVESGGLSRK